MISIRRLLTRRLMATTLGLVTLGLGTFLAVACYSVVRQFDIALRTKALAVTTATRVTADSVRVDFSDRFLRGFDDDQPRDFFEIWLPQGGVLAKSESLGEATLPHELGTFERPRYFLCTLPTGRPGRGLGFVFQPKQAPGITRRIQLEIVVTSDREELDHTITEFVGIAAACGILLLGATLWAVPRVLKVGLLPLAELGEKAASINAGSLDARFPVNGLPEELQPIGLRLNDLLARLECSFERERRFSADLAHELRTPIAELRSLAECSIKWPETRDATTDTEVLAIAAHMEGLATRMLALARERNDLISLSGPAFALAPFIEEAWRPFANRATERRLVPVFSIRADRVTADPVLLRSILSNLFDNAVDYAPEGGTIVIAAKTDSARATVSVTNPAENLDSADLSRLFDPFWRKNSARNGGRHFGLGLSLARSFASSMNWTLTARLELPNHLVLELNSN